MSSRFFRKSATASSVSSGGSTTSSPARSSSPCSPARTTRLQEKEQLVGLNTRLAAYIEKVRSLEQENSRLSLQIKSSQEVVTREVTNIKELYEDELSATRRIMDETASDRAKLQIDLGNVISEKDELSSKLHDKERDLKKADDQLNLQEIQMGDLQARMTRSLHDKKKAEDELKDVRQEVVRLRRQLEETRTQLESESLSRVELENQLQSQREQFEFKSTVYEEQLKETRIHSSREIDLVDGSLQTEYEDRMNIALQELRDQYEAKMAANREHFEKQYEKKLDELRGSQNRSQISTATTLKELRETRGRIESLTGRIAELEGANTTLISRVRDLEIQLDNERASSASLLAIKQEEMAALERRMQEQLQEYQDLMDLKVALDMEIAAYRKMLESEEARLNLSPLGHHAVRKSAMLSAGGSPAGMRSGKRKRTVVETSEQTCTVAFDVANTSHGAIELCDECPDGKFVKLRNKTDKEVSLGGMQLVRKAGDNETDYKFHRAIKLGPGEETTVWAAEAGAIHDAPHSLVMRGQTWFIGNQMTTTLFDMEGEEIAKRVSHRENSSATMSHIEHENGANDSQSSDWSLLNLFGGKRAVRQ